MPEETVMFSMRMPLALKSQLDAVARLDHRSTASLLQVVARAWLRQNNYQPSFDPVEAGALTLEPSDLRPAPGRPRTCINQRLNTDHFGPLIRAAIGARDRLKLDDVVNLTRAGGGTTMQMVREVLFRDGWREWRSETDEKVWTRPNHPQNALTI